MPDPEGKGKMVKGISRQQLRRANRVGFRTHLSTVVRSCKLELTIFCSCVIKNRFVVSSPKPQPTNILGYASLPFLGKDLFTNVGTSHASWVDICNSCNSIHAFTLSIPIFRYPSMYIIWQFRSYEDGTK